ncbi:hypothetical protein ACGF5O_18960 [Streptomyces sp. NPDC048291]|uniref:hypothetical protein n=1 Tax=Streptomyces sp. NPDC048291 TaxID=3365530 RepID=UPI003713AA81
MTFTRRHFRAGHRDHLAGLPPRPWEPEQSTKTARPDDPSTLIAQGGAGICDIAEMLRRTETSSINFARAPP